MFFPQKSRLHPQAINLSIKQTRPLRYRSSVCGNAAAEIHDSPHFPQSGGGRVGGVNRAPHKFETPGRSTGSLAFSPCQSSRRRGLFFLLLRECRAGETTDKPSGTCAQSSVKTVGRFRNTHNQRCFYSYSTHTVVYGCPEVR